MSSNSPAIQVSNLGKTFFLYDRPVDRLKQLFFGKSRHYGRAFVALSDISFTLPRGQVLGIIGNNGAGKSTLLQLLCRTLQPTEGSIQINGRIAALLELGAGFNPEFTGRENIFLNAAVLGLSHAEILARYNDIVAFSGIGDFIEQPVKTYSSGMYVRLAFSIATSVDPDILIIDEALSVGDGTFARKSFDRIMALRERGATILFCSHSMYQIEAICDQALWLEKGRLRMLGGPGTVTRAYARSLLPEVPANPLPDSPAGTGLIRLLRVDTMANGSSGPELTVPAGAADIAVNVRFSFDPALPMPSVAFGLDTAEGVAVSSGSSLFDGATARIVEPGVAEMVLCLPALPLMKGSYRLSIYLACERMLHVYDHAANCLLLAVTHPGKEQGVCFLPRRWNDLDVIRVNGEERS